jgi:hypothetical protein
MQALSRSRLTVFSLSKRLPQPLGGLASSLLRQPALFGRSRNRCPHAGLSDSIERLEAVDQTRKGEFPVAVLRTGIRRGDSHAGRSVYQPHRGVGDVSVLTARSAAPKGIDLNFAFEASSIDVIANR